MSVHNTAFRMVISLAFIGPGWVWAEEGPSFQDEIIPVLTRFGCNSGGCHGKLAGQNGFRLSLRGYAPEEDFDAIARDSRGRRISPAAPEQSLLIQKAVGRLPHGGGRRFAEDSPAAKLLAEWIRHNMPGPSTEEAIPINLVVSPAKRTLRVGETLSLRVTAEYSDGRKRDVTWLSQFASGDVPTLDVSDAGAVTAERPGETVVRAAFRGLVAIAEFTIPFDHKVDPKQFVARTSAVDGPVFEKLAALRIEPSPLCDDATFLRRATLDAIGTLPTPEEVRTFLADTRPDKRARLVEELLNRPEFIDYWTHWLADLLQNRKERDHDVRGTKGVRSFHAWLREQVAAGRSWRDITRDVLLATGPVTEHPEVGYYIVTVGEKEADQSEVGDSIAQAFLGTRVGCTRCHNHPLEKYTQDDYYHFMGFFSRIALDRRSPEEGATELIVGTRHLLNLRKQLRERMEKREELKASKAEAKQVEEADRRIAELQKQIAEHSQSAVEVRQPRTGKMLAPRPLDRSEIVISPGSDPRVAFVDWLMGPSNENFSGAMVNRLWKHFLGVALVEPVDDLRATNPPSNRALWELLNREFIASDYDMKHIMRLIMNSRAYQLSSETTASNFREGRFYSHYYARRLPAEVLLDALCSATGQPESFAGYPRGLRAVQVPDPFADSYFLTVFGRAARTTACACERDNNVTLPQLLHLQNSDELTQKIKSPEGRLARMLKEHSDDEALVEEIYLATLSRLPTETERQAILGHFHSSNREEVAVDLFWALLNTSEFTFNH